MIHSRIQPLLVQSCKSILDFLLPPTCALCAQRLKDAGSICVSCWNSLSFITDPYCVCCGYPFEISVETSLRCSRCLAQPPLFEQHRSILFYDESSKPLILKFKHSDGTHLVPLFTRWLSLSGRELIENCDILVPVPLHWRRLFHRRYNQAALLAQALARQFQKSYLPQALCRKRHTPTQGTKTRRQRLENVRGAIELGRQGCNIRGRKVLLIDDVFTSGATIQECVKVLLKQQADSVSVLTLARIIH